MNSAIIVAAGSGTRFGSNIPKQFLEILGKPVVFHSVAAFELAHQIDEIVLVVSETDLERAKNIAGRLAPGKLKSIVTGARMRAGSVKNGFEAVNASSAVVAVHDAARPLVLPNEIDDVIAQASETGAACLTLAVTDTIKEVREGMIRRTLDRDRLRRAVTPQAFRYQILERALSDSTFDISATDDCFLVEKLGYDIAFVDGNPHNMKITYPEDLRFAEEILRSRE